MTSSEQLLEKMIEDYSECNAARILLIEEYNKCLKYSDNTPEAQEVLKKLKRSIAQINGRMKSWKLVIKNFVERNAENKL